MSWHATCDFCGERMGRFEEWITLDITSPKHDWKRDYHDRCWQRVQEAIGMAQEFEGPLASIHVDSHQGIAAKRRRHKQPGQDEA
jgi:hypothetical protein